MDLREEYMVNRRLLQGRYRRLQKHGYTPRIKIPKIPKRITPASIRRLVKLISKTPTVRELNKKLGLTATGKIKKSTKKKIKKKAKELLTGKKSTKKKTTKKKPTSKKKTTSKKQEKYLPDETQTVLDNVANTLFGVDTIEELLDNMNAVIASDRYTTVHRERVSDLKGMLSRQYAQYINSENKENIADNLQANAESVNKGIEDITGYVFDSSEKDYQVAVEAVVELSYYLSGQKMDSLDLTRIENLYDEYKNELGGDYYDDMPFFKTMSDDLTDIIDEFDDNIVI